MTLSLRAQELPGVRRQKRCQKMDIKFCWQRNSKCPRYKSCSGQLIKRTVDLVQEYFGVAIPASVMCTPAESRGMIFTNDKGKEFRFEQTGLKKIAGVLTEAVSDVETGTVAHLMIGVGINFFVPTFPEELKDKAGSLFDSPPQLTRNELIAEIWRVFFSSEVDDLFQLYKQQSLVLGREISYQSQGQIVRARAVDILTTGELVVETEAGRQILSGGEISLSKW